MNSISLPLVLGSVSQKKKKNIGILAKEYVLYGCFLIVLP